MPSALGLVQTWIGSFFYTSRIFGLWISPVTNVSLHPNPCQSLRALSFSCLSLGRWRINLLSLRSPSENPTIFIVRVGSSLFAATLAIPEMQIFRCESRDNKLATAAAASQAHYYSTCCKASSAARPTHFWPWQSSPTVSQQLWKTYNCCKLKRS